MLDAFAPEGEDVVGLRAGGHLHSHGAFQRAHIHRCTQNSLHMGGGGLTSHNTSTEQHRPVSDDQIPDSSKRVFAERELNSIIIS